MLRCALRFFTVSLLMVGLTTQAADSTIFTKELTPDEVASYQVQQNWVVVDTRLSDAFNGWKLDGIKRGGHIPNAEDFSANWLKVKSKTLSEELNQALATKGITKEASSVKSVGHFRFR